MDMRLLIIVLVGAVCISGCSFADSSQTQGYHFLPEPKGDQPFLVGWQPDTGEKTPKEVHAELTLSYKRAVSKAAEEMGWELVRLVLVNATNVPTTPDPADFRAGFRYGIRAAEAGCEVTTEESGRVASNCQVMVIVGGLVKSRVPEQVAVESTSGWSFGQQRNHSIVLQSDDNTALPVTGFSNRVSAQLGSGLFMFLPQKGGQWLHQGRRVYP